MMKNKIAFFISALAVASLLASCVETNDTSSSQGFSDVVSQPNSNEIEEKISEDINDEANEEAMKEANDKTQTETSNDVSENVDSMEKIEMIKYAEDKSGYLKDIQTNNFNFNSRTIKAKDFSGNHFNTKIDNNGRFTLSENSTSGWFESEILNVGSFTTMLISWNAICGNGQMQVMVSYEAKDGTWSDYFTYGIWSDKNYTSTSKSVKNDFGVMNVDTFLPSKENTGNIKFKITVDGADGDLPVVENITVATSTMNSAVPAEYPAYAWNKVQIRSQHAPENGSDGNVMCSATTTAMALEYLGTYETTMDTAMGTWDIEFKGYGNWLFSSAQAAVHGYYTFCDFYTEDMMKYALSKGCVLGCSTYLTQSGHIVLVVGYETVDGVDYYIVNDPNVSSSEPTVTRYTCEYFNSVWIKESYNNTGVVYVYQGQY